MSDILRYLFTRTNRFLIAALITLVLVLTTSVITAEKDFIGLLSNYLQQGKQLYNRGRKNEAISIWQQAIKEYIKQGDFTNQAIGYNYLAIAL